MKIAMLGSMGHINRLVIPRLVEAGHDVTVVTTSASRQSAIEAVGAHAAIGTMQDVDFLTTTFTGQDVVYLMLSGATAGDLFAGALAQAKIWQQALTNAGVKNVVNLSSIGADADEIAGSLHAYQLIETQLKKLTGVNLAFVRPTGFYANLFSHLETLQKQHTLYSNQPASLLQKYVAPSDIADVVFPLINQTPTGITVNYAFSDTFTGEDFLNSLQDALKLPDLKWIQLSDDQYRQGLISHGVATNIADALVQTSRYQRDPEQVYADLKARHTPAGPVKLADFVKTYVQAYRGEGDFRSHTIAD